MKKSKPVISILITHYNRPTDLLQCVKAVHKANIANYEVVVSDDGSTIENIKIIETYNIDKLILSDVNNGLAANINKGLKACTGQYVIYCQEDFMIKPEINDIMSECINLLKSKKADLIRFSSYFQFNKLIWLTETISIIPKFSFYNFTQNYYRYSDHPFITKRSFYETYGYYLENTSGRYGEMEYGIRICNTSAKIAITNISYASTVEGSQSILINEFASKKLKVKFNKSFIKIARAIRLYFEWVFYDRKRRGLITYRNGRKQD
ncbi:MAG: glycosyltransferase family 2 protein [Flaviramulus sp.]|nr:glycosyltransferase family 2 protein [Flaviramulus sp.]NNC50927.1 glycosyltransferase family 2 protein [Flaviramulus sp.]